MINEALPYAIYEKDTIVQPKVLHDHRSLISPTWKCIFME